jgi:hypothetical protein
MPIKQLSPVGFSTRQHLILSFNPSTSRSKSLQFKVIAHLFALALVCLGMASCGFKSEAQTSTNPAITTTAQASTTQAPTLPAETKVSHNSFGVADKSGLRPFERFQLEARAYLYQEKFAELESMASEIRSRKERFPGGSWKLNSFYTGLGGPNDGDNTPQSEWEMHINKLRKWLSQSPDSITAHVGLAEALLNYAWQARGNGFSNTVTPEGGQVYVKFSAMAEEVLNDARRLSEKCPHWYVSMLRIAQGMGWDLASFDKLFDEAVALEPTYYYYYRVKAMNLLPRWHGQPGEWEQFIDEAARKMGGKQGAILYYLITSHLQFFYGTSYFEKSQVSWPKMKEGYIALEKTYGTDEEKMNEVCRLSMMAHDPMKFCGRPMPRP